MDFIFLGSNAANGYDSLGHFLRTEGVGTTCIKYAIKPAPGCSRKLFSNSEASAATTASIDPSTTTLVMARTLAVVKGATPAEAIAEYPGSAPSASELAGVAASAKTSSSSSSSRAAGRAAPAPANSATRSKARAPTVCSSTTSSASDRSDASGSRWRPLAPRARQRRHRRRRRRAAAAGRRARSRARAGSARTLALGALALVVLVIAYLVFGGGGGASYHLIFPEAGQLVRGDQVQVGGVPVGSVTDIELTKDFKAKVTIHVDSSLTPLHEGTAAAGPRAVALERRQPLHPAHARPEQQARAGRRRDVAGQRDARSHRPRRAVQHAQPEDAQGPAGVHPGHRRAVRRRGPAARESTEYFAPSLSALEPLLLASSSATSRCSRTSSSKPPRP